MKKKLFLLPVAILMVIGLLVGCGGGNGDSGSTGGDGSASGSAGGNASASGDTIKIGFVNPTTGALSGFGEGSPWIEQHVIDYVNEELGGIEVDGEMRKVELIMYDSKSDVTTVNEMVQKLIEEDEVDMMLARHTPETVNPTLALCERYQIPCVSTDAPMDAVLAEGPYEWSFHGHWDLETIYKCYQSLWEKAGFAKDSDAIVGLFFANDADGVAWNGIFTENLPKDGYKVVDPGMFPAGTQDFSDIISQFKSGNVQILAGTATNPDFSQLWRQCKQQNFNPEFVTMGKAYLLKSDAEAIGVEEMDGLCGEVWWSPTHPWTSALTGETPETLAKTYQEETGREITTPMGAKYYGVEIAVDALQRAGTLDKEAIRDAIAETDLETMFGHVKFEEDHGWRSSLTGGQWINEDGEPVLYVVDNSLYPNIPTTGELQPLNQ